MKRYESYKDSGVKWLGEIPGHWEVYKLKYLFRLNKIKNVGNKCNTILSLSYGKIIIKKDLNEGLTPESYESYQLLNKGDIVIRSTDLQNDHTSLRTGLVKSDGAITSAYIGLKNLNVNLYDSRYYHYFLHDWDITKAIYNEGKGLRQSLNWDDIKNMLLPVLDINEQTAIANYLDSVTSKIDEAISQQQKMIDLLNERKQIIIQNAVTKGLNPNAKMKDSGVEWIGEIPEDWEVLALKYCCSLKARIGWNGLKSEEFEEYSYAYLVTGQDFKGSMINWKKCYQINQKRYEEDPYIQINNGDLLITKDGTIGKIAKVINLDKPACLNSGIFVIKQTKNMYIQDYLFWMLSSNVLKEFNRFTQTGATIAHLYQNVFEQMPCVLPCIEEQRKISSYLNNSISKIDYSISQCNKMISLLQERKQIIINDVVTGKVKVI